MNQAIDLLDNETARLIRMVDLLRVELDAANERSRVMQADIARLTQENSGLAVALWKANHELDALRMGTPRPLTLTDRGDTGDEYAVAYDWEGR